VQQQLPTRGEGEGEGTEPVLPVAGLMRGDAHPSTPPLPEHRYAIPPLSSSSAVSFGSTGTQASHCTWVMGLWL